MKQEPGGARTRRSKNQGHKNQGERELGGQELGRARTRVRMWEGGSKNQELSSMN